jgi:hypothetical protein
MKIVSLFPHCSSPDEYRTQIRMARTDARRSCFRFQIQLNGYLRMIEQIFADQAPRREAESPVREAWRRAQYPIALESLANESHRRSGLSRHLDRAPITVNPNSNGYGTRTVELDSIDQRITNDGKIPTVRATSR